MTPGRKQQILPPREEGESIREARKRRLSVINDGLEKLGLIPFEKLGDYRKGEDELLAILSYSGNEYLVLVTFEIIFPDGNRGTRALLFNRDQAEVGGQYISGCICLVTVRDEVGGEWMVFTRQHRLANDGWDTWPIDVPRGFFKSAGLSLGASALKREVMPLHFDLQERRLADIPISIVGRKLAALVSSSLVTAQGFSILGISPENNGAARNLTLVAHLRLSTTDIEQVRRIGGTKSVRIEYHLAEEVRSNWVNLGLSGHQSATALMFYFSMVK